MPEEDISPVSKLLRMRRNEQPPPEYFETFLREFQQRQRAELLRRPAWRIGMERLQARLGDLAHGIGLRFAPAQFAYAGASAAVLAVATVFTVHMLRNPGGEPLPAVAVAAGPTLRLPSAQGRSPADLPVQRASGSEPAVVRFSLNPEIRFPDPFSVDAASISQPVPREYPRYILDTRPASYEPPSSF